MAKVTNLKIQLQSGTDNTLFASWNFSEPAEPPTGGGGSGGSGSSIKVGAHVKVKPGAKWYNGVGIASFVFNETWIVFEVRGDRAVIHRNTSGTYAIMSAIHVNNLTVV